MPHPPKRDSTERFTDRVDNYVKYRPSYPEEVLAFMTTNLGLTTRQEVVDVGSGTGISSELFLKNGNTVFAVEPNDAMREAAEKRLANYPGFRSVKGRSDATSLADLCADFVIAAQAFHWFEPVATKREFRRILRTGGWTVLVWNDRRTAGDGFSEGYEELLNEFGTDYREVNHRNMNEDKIGGFLGAHGTRQFPNFQELDFEGLLGRLASSSYAPNVGHPRFVEMRDVLRRLFDRFNRNGLVKVAYDTRIFYSQMT